jgi:hypothetical protein
MSNKPVEPGDLQSLWQSMPTPPVTITVEEMRTRSVAFDKKVGSRNLIEYIAAAFVVVIFGWYATWPIPATPLWPIANIAIIIGTLVVVWNLHRIAGANGTPGEASLATLIDHHRSGLVKQRDALRSVWRWYLLPFAPGLALWFTALWVGAPEGEKKLTFGLGLGMAALLSIAVSGFIILVNLIGAARLQRMIDDIDRFGDQ